MASATAYVYSLESFNINFTDTNGDPVSTTFPNSTPDNSIYGGNISIKPNYSVDSFSVDPACTSFAMDSAQSDGSAASTLQVDQAHSLIGSENPAVGDELRLLYACSLSVRTTRRSSSS